MSKSKSGSKRTPAHYVAWTAGSGHEQRGRAPTLLGMAADLCKSAKDGTRYDWRQTWLAGVFTDGRIMLEITPTMPNYGKATAKLEADYPPGEKGGFRPIHDTARMMLKTAKCHGEAAAFIAWRVKDGECELMLEDGRGERAAVKAKYVGMAQRLYPDCVFHLDARRDADEYAVIIVSGGERVGMLMPLGGEQVKVAIIDAETGERVAALEQPDQAAPPTPEPTPTMTAETAAFVSGMEAFTTGEAAKICQVAPRTISKWFDSGRLKGYREPQTNNRMIPRRDLIAFLEDNGMPVPDSLRPVAAAPVPTAEPADKEPCDDCGGIISRQDGDADGAYSSGDGRTVCGPCHDRIAESLATPAPAPATTEAPATMTECLHEAKRRHPGVLCVFRVGDFYEFYGADAVIIGKALNLATVTRQDGAGKLVMGGFPHAALEDNLRTLLRAGHRIAVCDRADMKAAPAAAIADATPTTAAPENAGGSTIGGRPATREIVSLASGTLARLFGVAAYSGIDAATMKWCAWADAQSKDWPTWVDCWVEYSRATTAAAEPAPEPEPQSKPPAMPELKIGGEGAFALLSRGLGVRLAEMVSINVRPGRRERRRMAAAS
jgi:pyruvate/2-oxoglutarate dehydrogenase complex dihydrolipoamide acyltransferase (E2) component